MQTLSTISNIRRKSQSFSRRSGDFKGQAKIDARSAGADGFLNHAFAPLCHAKGKLPDREQSEMGFFQSAERLCALHGFPLPAVDGLPYPYNMLLAHRDIKTKLNRQPYKTELIIARNQVSKETVLTTKQVYETGNTLYYIPVIPLYKFGRKKKNKACGQLLTTVMSYLYREAGIPYYRDEGSFMFDEHEMNKEYFLECRNESPDDYEEDLTDIIKNDICGDIMQRKIHNAYHLMHFEQTIASFKPQNSFDQECLLVAQDALNLYRDFPNNNVFQHIEMPEDEEEAATPETYFSFIGDGKGWVYENIERSVNDVLGNYSEMALPTRSQTFDENATDPETLEFEYRLFELITDLCNILFDLP